VRLKSGKRVKWEPAALMILVLGLGLWLAVGPASGPSLPVRPGATTLKLRIGDRRGVVEMMPGTPDHTFRVLRPNFASPEMSAVEFKQQFGEDLYNDAIAGRRNWVFKLLNITSWINLTWVAIGFFGQFLFSGRMLLQWLVSERKRQSVITESFWWFSLLGAVALFTYSVWRQDPVYILGQASGIVIYARNLRLIHKQKRRAARVGSALVRTAG